MTGSQRNIRHRKRRRGWFHKTRGITADATLVISLLTVPIGESVRIVNFSPRVTKTQQAYLNAYGVTPGQRVRVIQQSPVTVVHIDHLELAMEHNLAKEISVMQDNTNHNSTA